MRETAMRDENKNTVRMDRRLDVEEQLDRLHIRLCRLDSLAGDLRERLTSVMRNPEPCPESECEERGALTPLGNHIQENRHSVDVVIKCLEDIIERLELGIDETKYKNTSLEWEGGSIKDGRMNIHSTTGPKNPPRPNNDCPRG